MTLFHKHPQYLLRLDVRPPLIRGLSDMDETVTELCIRGDIKNIQRLKDFKRLEKLWVYSVNQKQLDLILQLVNPKMLSICGVRAEDLSSFELVNKIEVLELESVTRAERLWDLSATPSLKALSIAKAPKLTDLSALETETALELFDLSGGGAKDLTLPNLLPLRSLKHLKYLGLSNIRVLDESLDPIAGLNDLQELGLSNQFPTEEFAKLSVLLPTVKCNKFKAYLDIAPMGNEDVMIIGKRKPFLNSKTHKERLEKYEQEFRAFQEKYRPTY